MRRITNSTNVTLDGVSGRLPEWHVGYMDDEAVGVTTGDLLAAEVLLMGRRTYDLHPGAVAHLDLAAHRALESGVVLLTYRPRSAS